MLTEAADIHRSLGLRNIETARILAYLGSTLQKLSEYDASLETYEEALAVAEDATGPDSDTVLWIKTDLGEVFYVHGEFERVADTLRDIIDIRRARYGESDQELHTNQANLAVTLEQMGRYDEAIEIMQEALAWYRENLGEEHSLTLGAREALARLEFARGNHDESFQIYRDVIDDYRRHFGPEHSRVGDVLFQFAVALSVARQNEEAEARFREALAIQEKVFGRDHAVVGRILGRLAVAVSGQGRKDEALEMQQRALAIYKANGETDTVHYAWAQHEYANILLEADRCDEAMEAEEVAVGILTDIYGADSDRTLTGRHTLALITVTCGDVERGIELTRAVLSDRERLLPEGHPDISISVFNLGFAYRDGGDLEHAMQRLTQACDLYEAMGAGGDDLRMLASSHLAMMLTVLDRPTEAARYAQSATEWYHEHKSAEDPRRILAETALAMTRLALGDDDAPGDFVDARPDAFDPFAMENHKNAAFVALTLGRCLAALGQHDDSRPYVEGALSLLVETWGEEHPYTQWARDIAMSLNTSTEPD